jgi:curved DNA-binding protein CbpA
MSKEFDPKKIIDFSKDYYNILGLIKETLPKGKNRQDKIELSKMLEVAFRKMARKSHPDFGGSNEAFLDLVRARRIVEDPILRKIYDQGYFDEFTLPEENNQFQVDWAKIGTYRPGTPEDTVGYSLFLKLCNLKDTLNIVPAFCPDSNEQNYEWDFVIKSDKNEVQKLVISIVNDENEVLRLTSGNNLEHALPFKIYICIPKAGIVFSRGKDAILGPNNKVMANASINSVSFQDLNFCESTNLDFVNNYIENKISIDLEKFHNNDTESFIKKELKETKLLDLEAMKKFDDMKLSQILNLRSYEIVNDEEAANFIENIDKTSKKTLEDKKPELPL